MDPETKAAFASLVKLIDDHSQSLQTEMQTGFDRIEAATARNTKMLVAGTRAIGALNGWTEGRDKLDRKRDAAIQDLRMRVRKLERKTKRRA
ncbi:MAG TPA: hypothetical protein VN754_12820 [Candidatus Binataceae bacterium]|nr:hypothetical protein SBA4_5370009 [Candidatus Sulfopaludibacter sp. SbA4]HXR36831.1 hypothetical protein [Candidatus Binataceae bacterium]